MADARLTIGRVGLSVASGSEVDPFPGITWDGDRVTFSGMLKADTTNGGAILRQQLNGYGPHNTDEQQVAVTWSGDASVDGFYEVVSSEVQADAGSYVGDNWWFPFRVDLVRTEDSAAPQMEVVASIAPRATSFSFTNSFSVVGFGLDSSVANGPMQASDTGLANFSVGGENGDISRDGQHTNGIYTWTFTDTPGAFYDAAPRIETQVDGAWTPVVGRQAAVAAAGGWRLNNGLLRVQWDTNSASATRLLVEAWNASSNEWQRNGPAPSLRIAASVSVSAPSGKVRILENSIQRAAIRVPLYESGSYAYTLDLSLSKGHQWAEGQLASLGAATKNFGVGLETAAYTTVTGGANQATADTNGNTVMVRCPSTVTVDNTNGRLNLTSAATTFSFGLTLSTGLTSIQMSQRYLGVSNSRLNVGV